MNKIIYPWRLRLAAVTIVLILLGITTTLALGAKPPGIYPPDSKVYGLTYGQWSALWWDWAYSIPSADSPFLDTTGEKCGVNQIGPVWFLAGTLDVIEQTPGAYVGNADRNCNIPANKAIFFPVLNAECSTIEGNGTTEQGLRDCAVALLDGVTSLFAEIDGVPVESLTPPNSPYRVQSPLFVFALPPGDILGKNTGSTYLFSQAVSDGYWIMLKPLSPGKHTVHFGGAADLGGGNTFSLDVTYNLKVTK